MSSQPVRVFVGSGEASLLERKTLIHSLRKHTRRPLDLYVFNGTHNAIEHNDEPPQLAPMSLRHRVKKWLWGTQPKDTFPTCFRMNTRSALRRLFAGAGMHEAAFLRLDDCRTFARFRWLHELELRLMRACRALRVPYPEHCLLGVYRRR